MISVYNIKPQFQRLLHSPLVFLHNRRVSANQITVWAGVLSAVIGILFWYAGECRWLFLVLPVGLFLRMALNALDGMMARTYNQSTPLGEILNELGDVVSDVIVFFPLLKYQAESIYLVVIFIVMSVINEFAGVLGKVVAGERRYEGPMGKSDRTFMLGLYGVLMLCGVNLAGCSAVIFGVLIILLMLSTFLRIKKTLQKV